jgi:hypothetical protein
MSEMPYRKPRGLSLSLGKGGESFSLQEAMQLYLKKTGLQARFGAVAVEKELRLLLGNMISSRLEKISLENGVLRLEITSSAVRQQVLMLQDEIIADLNKKIGADLVKSLLVY